MDRTGKAIHVYNIGASTYIATASVRGQCSNSYFYGKDLQLDARIRLFETNYSDVLRRALPNPRTTQLADLKILRDFMVLQFSRTEAAITRMASVYRGMLDTMNYVAPGSVPALDTGHRRMMLKTLETYGLVRSNITDLRLSLVINEASLDFITSDDPTVFSSRYHAELLKTNNFGIGGIGVFFVLPLSPRLLLLAYDPTVYAATSGNHHVLSIDKNRDVYACNELQCLNASQNIYFSDWRQRDQIASHVKAVASLRGRSRANFATLVPESRGPQHQTYRRAEMHEAKGSQRALIAVSAHNVVPRLWMSKLRFRKRLQFRPLRSGVDDIRKHVLQLRERERRAR